MRCDICNSNETYIKRYVHNYEIKGRKITFESDRRFCSKCNNLVYDSVLDNKASETALSIYNCEYGISKEEIIELRNKYGFSQDLFSKVIGCAKKTLISYEKGKSIPNDSYLIILRSLLFRPDTINVIVEANKEHFTDKELNKISKKVTAIMPNNANQLLFDSDNSNNEYKGYTKLSKEKIYNMILYFSEGTVLKTKLLKEMFYTDFLYYKNNCKSITGLEYAKITHGPVPDQFELILNKCKNEGIINYEITYNDNYESHNISANKKYNKNVFDNNELKVLDKVKNKFKSYKPKDIVELSHKEKAFIETKYGDKISYDYAFDMDSFDEIS